jgi:hypothetical protein
MSMPGSPLCVGPNASSPDRTCSSIVVIGWLAIVGSIPYSVPAWA